MNLIEVGFGVRLVWVWVWGENGNGGWVGWFRGGFLPIWIGGVRCKFGGRTAKGWEIDPVSYVLCALGS